MAILKREAEQIYLLIAILSLIGLGLSLLSTSLFGIGLSPDSVQYIATARNLLQGKFFVTLNDAPMVLWPPLFPTLLAGISFFSGLDPLESARYVNAGAFCLTIGAAGVWFYQQFQTKLMVLCGTLATVLATSLLSASSIALTEALFSLLVILFLISLPKCYSGKLSKLLPVTVVTALCCLQRYMGVAVLITGLIMLISWFNKTTRFQKLKMIVVYGAGSSIPLALWVIHNYLLTGSLTGPRSPGTSSIFENVLTTTYVIFNWFLPLNVLQSSPTLFIITLVFLSLVLFVITAVILRNFIRTKNWTMLDDKSSQTWSSVIFIIIYSLWLLISTLVADFDAISDRLLIPVYVPLIFLLLEGSRKLLGLNLSKLIKPSLLKVIVFGAGLFCLLYFSISTGSFLVGAYQNGASGYNTNTWRYSVTMQWLKNNPTPRLLYSNAADAIYILTGKTALVIPPKTADSAILDSFKTQLQENKGLVVYFDESIVGRPYLMPEKDIVGAGFVEIVEISSDGRVYGYRG